MNYFMGNNLKVMGIPGIKIVIHENWGEKQVRDTHHIKKLQTPFVRSWLPASSANNYTLLPEQAPAAFLLVSVCTLLDTVIVVEEEEEFVNTDFDLSEVFPRIWSIRR